MLLLLQTSDSVACAFSVVYSYMCYEKLPTHASTYVCWILSLMRLEWKVKNWLCYVVVVTSIWPGKLRLVVTRKDGKTKISKCLCLVAQSSVNRM
jgi:hypothetical protein